MTRILHLAELWNWEAAQASGLYRCSTRGATLGDVGFIHCSAEEQLGRVASVVYSDFPGDLVVLELDAATIADSGARIRWENGGNGEEFPHLYGELKIEWVSATHSASMDGSVLVAPGLLDAEGFPEPEARS